MDGGRTTGTVQAHAQGYWQFTHESPFGSAAWGSWIALEAGSSEDQMTLTWPTGVNCGTEQAHIVGNEVRAAGTGFPAVVTIRSAREATLSLHGDPKRFSMRKTRSDARVACE
jgi:hypothetical protein